MSTYTEIDVVVTATIRPEILSLTLSSFHRNFLSQFKNTRLIINIDPIGDSRYKPADILRVCERYFSTITYRSPETPSFPSAVKWCWEQVSCDLFLHLEDDWLLKKRIDVPYITGKFKEDIDLASIRFNLTHNPKTDSLNTCGLALNPSVIRKTFIAEALPFFSLELDPEKQYSVLAGPRKAALQHWKHMLYGRPAESSYVIDIGKKWRMAQQFMKWEAGTPSITWRKRSRTHLYKELGLKGFYWAYLNLLRLVYA